MDVEVIEVQREKRHRNGKNGKKHDPNMTEKSTSGGANSKVDDPSTKPHVGMEFNSEESAKNCYDTYAKQVGFTTHVGRYTRAKPDGPINFWEFSCSREILKQNNTESCSAMLHIKRKDPDRWIVSKFVEEHNHSTQNTEKMHYLRPKRHFTGATINLPETPDPANDVVISSNGTHVSPDPNRVVRDASPAETNYNNAPCVPPVMIPPHFIQPCMRRTLGRDAQNLLTYFKKLQAENLGFYYAVQLDDDNRLSNVFWSDSRSRNAYTHFGDAVTFDTMYRPNQFRVPLAPFTGLNHHGQMVLFGCALLFDESEASFSWLFSTFLSAMNNRAPVSLTTDQDRAIKAAAHRVFPKTRHCICKWHILREGQERLAHIYVSNPSFYGDLYSCINFSETIEDFESKWGFILDSYNLRKNDWLQAVYNARKQWAPVYFRDTFFAALPSNHGASSFFDGYVNQQTTLPTFFKQYERALENSIVREIDADYDTISATPVLKTPSPMEQQAANLYTKKVFAKFQEELVETFVYTANKIDGDGGAISKFRVAKYEHDHKEYIVTLDVSQMNTSCSCQMFEYSGVLCRHVLTVFTVTNVLTVPPHYILKRWTQNARVSRSEEKDLDTQSVNSLGLRFKNLCLEALKFAEEGAVDTETYGAAMDALQEGAQKIASARKNVAKITPLGSGNFQENGGKKDSVSISGIIPLPWPLNDSVSNQFNLNDAGVVNVADLNTPTMASVVVNRDGVLADNTAVLTCFKSMRWVIENKAPSSKVAVINMKLQDYGKTPLGETEVQFRLTRATLDPMVESMTCISEQLSLPANRVAVINLKLHDAKTTTGEAEVKFQVSRDTLGSMLRSMTYIREQL